MRIYGVFKATHSRMHVKWGLGPARVRRGRTVPNEMNQKCPWMEVGLALVLVLMLMLELGLGIRNAIKISCHILITPRGVLYFLYVVQRIRLKVCASLSLSPSFHFTLPNFLIQDLARLHLMLTNWQWKFL